MSFMRFLGLGLDDKVPDAKTIWLFKDTLTKAGIIDQLFSQFNRLLEERGIITHKGTIVDATFVDTPRQRNSRDENEKIKNGETPEKWNKNPHKMAQKDVDALWTKKRDETHFRFYDHVHAWSYGAFHRHRARHVQYRADKLGVQPLSLLLFKPK